MQTDSDLMILARQLPCGDDENLRRIKHARKHGHILIQKEGNDVIGYATVFRMKQIPDYPVIPWPMDDPSGEYLYCFEAVSKKIGGLIHMARTFFPDCHIVWHRYKKNNRVSVMPAKGAVYV